MMKKILHIMVFSLLPTIALAAGDHGEHTHAAPGLETPMSHALSPGGGPGDPSQVTRTIEIGMLDTMRFSPGEVHVKAGETVRFAIANAGKLPHELVIGSLADLKAHAIEMRKNPGMRHDEPNAITLNPGQRGSLVWKFDRAGTVDFACTIPGHMEAGMIGRVQVE